MSKPDYYNNYEEELKKYCVMKGIWDYENDRPTRFVTNTLKTVKRIHPAGYTYYENVIDGFTTKRPKFKTCLYCLNKLNERQRKFCSLRCADLHNKIKKKREEIGAEGVWITKNEDREIPQWKDMTVTFRGKNGELITRKNAITKKSGKPLKKSTKSKEFSEGKDY